MKRAVFSQAGQHTRWLSLAGAIIMLGMLLNSTSGVLANGDSIHVSIGKSSTIQVARGKPLTVETAEAFDEIVIGAPDVATINPLTDHSFYVLGQGLGTTGIALYDESKRLIGTIDVEVTLDTKLLANTIRETVPGSSIKVTSANGRIVLSGTAPDAVAAENARQIAARFADEEVVINTIDITSSQQVQLNVRFVEINRSVGKELGTRISAAYMTSDGGIAFNSAPDASNNTPASELIGSLISNGFSIDVAIDALEDRGMARRLAEPNLIARSGETASFLAGGEFPIPVSEEDGRVTVDYKNFGVSLDFTPTVLSDGLIAIDIEPEVSSIDTTSSYRVGNIAIPGFSVRRARTSVDLRSGQSFMIAGLLQSQNDISIERVPGLGKLPVLGALFSSKAYQRRETDLVIIITPHLVSPIPPSNKVATPADKTSPPRDDELFLGNIEEVAIRKSATATATPPSGHFLELP